MVWFGLIPVRSPLLREYYPFLGVVRCFSSPGCLRLAYVFSEGSHDTTRAGLPHSEIPGYASSRLTGAYRSVATSFIGLRRQGIHPAPLVVCAGATRLRAAVPRMGR